MQFLNEVCSSSAKDMKGQNLTCREFIAYQKGGGLFKFHLKRYGVKIS